MLPSGEKKWSFRGKEGATSSAGTPAKARENVRHMDTDGQKMHSGRGC
jgi:hypothetical protein